MKIKTEPKLLKRSLSAIIDYGVYMVYFIWLIVTFGKPNNEGGYSLNGLKAIWIEIGWFIFFPLIESIRGQTLGKLILGLTVVTKTGNPITLWQATKRHLVDILDFFFFGLVALITIKKTPHHQRLGDLLANTIVIGDESYTCSYCREALELSVEEVRNKRFICPKCNSSNEFNNSYTVI